MAGRMPEPALSVQCRRHPQLHRECDTKPFNRNSTERQLHELWELDPSDPGHATVLVSLRIEELEGFVTAPEVERNFASLQQTPMLEAELPSWPEKYIQSLESFGLRVRIL